MGVNRDLVFTILGIDKGSDAFDKVGDSADKAQDRLRSFSSVGTKVLAGFPVAAMAAGVATAGALAAVGVGVAGVAAIMLRNNKEITQAGDQLWADLHDGAEQAVAPLAGDLTNALKMVHGAVKDLTPQFKEMFGAAGPAIDHLASGVVRFARNAMPGFVTAVETSGPALQGMESLLADTGTGLTRFFTNLSKGSESSGQIMASTGRIVSDFLGFAGSLFAELSNSGAPAVATLEGFLGQLEGTVLSLAHGAFPGLALAAQGFMTVGSGILGILNLLAPVLGPLIGNLGTFAITLKLVDAVSMGQVSTGFAGLKQAIGEAEGAGGKLKAGFGGLMSTGLLPLGIIAAGLGVVLTGLGSAQERAAKDAAAHEGRINSLTSALRQSNGAIDGNVTALAAKSLSEQEVGRTGKNVLQVAREGGITLSTLTDAYLGNADAQGIVTRQMDEFIKSNAVEGTAMDATSSAVNDLRDMFPGLNGEYATSAQRAKDLAAAQADSAKATDDHKKSIMALRAQMEEMVNKDLAYRNSVDATEKAQKTATDALKAHGVKSEEYTDALRGVEGAMIHQAQAAKDLGIANSASADEAGKATDGQKAYAREIVNMATAAGKNAPPALRQMLSSLSDSDLAAQGASRSIDGTGQAVYRLPNGKTITISAQDDATFRAARISEYIQSLPPFKHITITVDQMIRSGFTTVGTAPGSSPMSQGRSTGGWVTGPGTSTSDSIPTMLSNKEFVVNAEDAERNRSVLEAINAGRDPVVPARGEPTSGRSAGGVTNNYNLTVVQAGNSRVDLQKQFRAMELMSGVV